LAARLELDELKHGFVSGVHVEAIITGVTWSYENPALVGSVAALPERRVGAFPLGGRGAERGPAHPLLVVRGARGRHRLVSLGRGGRGGRARLGERLDVEAAR